MSSFNLNEGSKSIYSDPKSSTNTISQKNAIKEEQGVRNRKDGKMINYESREIQGQSIKRKPLDKKSKNSKSAKQAENHSNSTHKIAESEWNNISINKKNNSSSRQQKSNQ